MNADLGFPKPQVACSIHAGGTDEKGLLRGVTESERRSHR
jgi:hypothetical protein